MPASAVGRNPVRVSQTMHCTLDRDGRDSGRSQDRPDIGAPETLQKENR